MTITELKEIYNNTDLENWCETNEFFNALFEKLQELESEIETLKSTKANDPNYDSMDE